MPAVGGILLPTFLLFASCLLQQPLQCRNNMDGLSVKGDFFEKNVSLIEKCIFAA